jgi:hypothetical protein
MRTTSRNIQFETAAKRAYCIDSLLIGCNDIGKLVERQMVAIVAVEWIRDFPEGLVQRLQLLRLQSARN